LFDAVETAERGNGGRPPAVPMSGGNGAGTPDSVSLHEAAQATASARRPSAT
jgi:hypothetical protein